MVLDDGTPVLDEDGTLPDNKCAAVVADVYSGCCGRCQFSIASKRHYN